MIPVFRPYADDKEIEYLKKVIDSGWWGLGPKTKEFEEKFADFVGCKYGIGLNSATAALDLAFRIVDVKEKEVITTSMTFVSTNHAILYNNGIPVFCDIDPETLNIDPSKIEELITDKTKAVVVVHYGGRACEMDKIMNIASNYGLKVVEDCAHSSGGKYKNKMLGSIGDYGCFSFHPVKNLATGDGGMLTTNDKEAKDFAMKYRWVGITKDTFSRDKGKYSWFYDVVSLGYKYHMNDIAAAVALAQFEKLEWMNGQREKWTNYYNEKLNGVGDIETPSLKNYMKPSYHNYVIKTERRDELQEFLKIKDISTGVHYYPNHLYDMYKPYYRELPITESIWKKIITLPLYPGMTEEEANLVIGSIKEFFSK